MVMGEHDTFASPDFMSSVSGPAIWRGGVLTISGAGHALFRDAPAAFNALPASLCATSPFARGWRWPQARASWNVSTPDVRVSILFPGSPGRRSRAHGAAGRQQPAERIEPLHQHGETRLTAHRAKLGHLFPCGRGLALSVVILRWLFGHPDSPVQPILTSTRRTSMRCPFPLPSGSTLRNQERSSTGSFPRRFPQPRIQFLISEVPERK